MLSSKAEQSLVLIDEVDDKADIDFPNDLLDVLDRFEFDIEELPRSESESCATQRGFGRHVSAPRDAARPIVVITSNREKQLPEPFLRRCLARSTGVPDRPRHACRYRQEEPEGHTLDTL